LVNKFIKKGGESKMKKLIVLSFIAALVLSTGLVFAADQATTVPAVTVATTTVATPAKAAKVKKAKKVKAAKKVVKEVPVAPVTK